MQSTDEEWKNFLMGLDEEPNQTIYTTNDKSNHPLKDKPICDDLNISTKTKVLYLNQEIDIHSIFWNIPIIEYWRPKEGVIKKQMKIVSKSIEEYNQYQKRLEGIPYYTDFVIKQINNPNARRIKFKDERKITIGMSKKDIMNCRGKQKNAFYNCFAMILRFYCHGEFKEIHVKVFNTGKLEIPGILNNELLTTVQRMILEIIQPYILTPIEYIETDRGEENVLINSNFNCGFYINRDKLHAILRSEKYGLGPAYDPCSYPGVKCKYYFNNAIGYDSELQTGKILNEDRTLTLNELNHSNKYTEINFMIFRTGSCLIVGNCSEKCLLFVFEFIKQLLMDEYENISVDNDGPATKVKKSKLRKKTIHMTNHYYQENILI